MSPENNHDQVIIVRMEDVVCNQEALVDALTELGLNRIPIKKFVTQNICMTSKEHLDILTDVRSYLGYEYLYFSHPKIYDFYDGDYHILY